MAPPVTPLPRLSHLTLCPTLAAQNHHRRPAAGARGGRRRGVGGLEASAGNLGGTGATGRLGASRPPALGEEGGGASRPPVDWARPYLRRPDKLHRMMDPSLEGSYSDDAAAKAATVAYNCLHSLPKSRPTMREVVDALEPLLSLRGDVPAGTFVYTAPSVAAAVVADNAEVDREKDHGDKAEVDREKDRGGEATAMKKMAVQRGCRHRYTSSVAGRESGGSPMQTRDRGA